MEYDELKEFSDHLAATTSNAGWTYPSLLTDSTFLRFLKSDPAQRGSDRRYEYELAVVKEHWVLRWPSGKYKMYFPTYSLDLYGQPRPRDWSHGGSWLHHIMAQETPPDRYENNKIHFNFLRHAMKLREYCNKKSTYCDVRGRTETLRLADIGQDVAKRGEPSSNSGNTAADVMS